MEASEVKAVKACQAGDLEQFGLLYDKYIKKIYDFIYYKTNHKETAEDITSTVFIKAVEKVGSFKFGQNASFQAWLYQIARNTVIDHYRTAKPADNVEDYWGLSDNTDIERDADNRRHLAEVEEYLKALKPEQREIIIMRVWQGLSYAEIAEITGKSEASCKMSYSRVIRKLRGDMPIDILIFLLLFT